MAAFPDLRPATRGPQSDESFWPSFTDIMMVVVMIFLISTTLLIVRNSELVRELTSKIDAERQARREAQSALAKSLTLEERVAALEDLLADARLRRLQTEEEKADLQQRVTRLMARLAESRQAAEALKAQVAARTAEIQSTLQRLARLEDELKGARAELEATRSRLSETTARLASASSTVASLRAERERQQAALQQARQAGEISEEKLARLRAEYQALKGKYDKLVRPARTTKGKHVVAVRFYKRDGQPVYEIKAREDGRFRAVPRAELERRLGALKQRYGKDLYIRIIFPDEAGLSYREAWQFTRDLLNKYDYYYQDNRM